MTHHTFVHTFRDGSVLALYVDVSTTPMSITSSCKVLPSQSAEYNRWLNEVIAPELVRLSSVAQLEACAQKGLEVLS